MKGIVLSYIRRKANVLTEGGIKELLIERKFDALLPGDVVQFNQQEICEILPRSNVFKRSYLNKTKEIAANIDVLLIIAAPDPLFNTTVIDRLIASAVLDNIKICLVLNKCDLGYENKEQEISYYRSLGIAVVKTTAKGATDISELINHLQEIAPAKIVLAGVSGVGKSSLLKTLLPEAELRTNEVSDKTGQGRQTTTLAYGYAQSSGNILYDLPGIQNFGLSHLTRDLVAHGFTDILKLGHKCKFGSGCQHISEPACAVKAALEASELLPSRYDSYLQLLDEVIKANTY